MKEGTGSKAEAGDDVDVAYIGTLESDGSQFDRAAHFKFTLGGVQPFRTNVPAGLRDVANPCHAAGEVIKGWDRGVVGMCVGEKVRPE